MLTAAVVEALPQFVNGDPSLVRRGRFLTTDFLVGVGATEYVVSVVAGRVEAVARGPFRLRSWTFAVRASEDAWRRFWEPVPEPGYHDLFAMTKAGVARLEGRLEPVMANLRYVKDVLAAPRRAARG